MEKEVKGEFEIDFNKKTVMIIGIIGYTILLFFVSYMFTRYLMEEEYVTYVPKEINNKEIVDSFLDVKRLCYGVICVNDEMTIAQAKNVYRIYQNHPITENLIDLTVNSICSKTLEGN